LLASYTDITTNVVQYLNCIWVGQSLLIVTYPAIDCQSDDYKTWLGVVLLVLVSVVILFPLGLIVFLMISRRHILELNSKFHQYFGILFEPYSQKYFWWHGWILIRRAGIAGSAAAQALGVRSFLFVVINFVCLQVHQYFLPYKSVMTNNFETVSLTLLTILAVLLATYGTDSNESIALHIIIIVLVVVPAMIFLVFFSTPMHFQKGC